MCLFSFTNFFQVNTSRSVICTNSFSTSSTYPQNWNPKANSALGCWWAKLKKIECAFLVKFSSGLNQKGWDCPKNLTPLDYVFFSCSRVPFAIWKHGFCCFWCMIKVFFLILSASLPCTTSQVSTGKIKLEIYTQKVALGTVKIISVAHLITFEFSNFWMV